EADDSDPFEETESGEPESEEPESEEPESAGSEEAGSAGSEDAFDALAEAAAARAAQMDASMAEADDSDPFEETESGEPESEEPESEEPESEEPESAEPVSAATGGIPGLVWGIAAAIAAVVVVFLFVFMGGGSSTTTTAAATTSSAAPTTSSGVAASSSTSSTTSTTEGSTESSSSTSSSVVEETQTFGGALQELVDSDPATFGLLQNFVDLLAGLPFGWTGSVDYAFDLFNVRRTGAQALHPNGSERGSQSGSTDVVKVSGLRASLTQQAADAAFNNSDYPCGEGEIATTFCTDAAPDVPAGDIVMIGATLLAPIPLESPDRSFLYFVGIDDGDASNNVTEGAVGSRDYAIGTDRRFLLAYGPSDGWTFTVEGADEPSAARFMVREDAVLLVIPAGELPGSPAYRFATFENAGDTLDLTNTSDWAGDVVPNVGAQLLPIIPLEPPTVIELGSAEDPTGDAGSCPAAADVTGVTHLVRARQARLLVLLADDASPLLGDGIGLEITMEHPGGVRTWTIEVETSRTTLRADDPFAGENPRVFSPTGPEIIVDFENNVPSGSSFTVVTKDSEGAPCDTVEYTSP
ncbi:MAG TPA: hypothetical protein VLD62_08295, partial [Acidimicrobiia bacterium]|nr:hypothetical protein [Acidimicrobiia bacterium]